MTKTIVLWVLRLILAYQKAHPRRNVSGIEAEAYRIGVEARSVFDDTEVQTVMKQVLTNALAQDPDTAKAGESPAYAEVPRVTIGAIGAAFAPPPAEEAKAETPAAESGPPKSMPGYGFPVGAGKTVKGRYIPTKEEVLAAGYDEKAADDIIAREEMLAENPDAEIPQVPAPAPAKPAEPKTEEKQEKKEETTEGEQEEETVDTTLDSEFLTRHLNKDDLTKLAKKEGVEVGDEDTKATIANNIVAKRAK